MDNIETDPRTTKLNQYLLPFKKRSDTLAGLYEYAGMIEEAKQVTLCADKIVIDENTGKIVYVMYCRNKLCPLTAEASKYRIVNDMRETLTHIDYNRYAFNMLTLTVPSVPADALADEVKNLDYAWNKFKSYLGIKPFLQGWQKVTEIDFNAKNSVISYHPHLHVITAYDPASDAVRHHRQPSQYQIADMWSKAAGRLISPQHGVNNRPIESDDYKSEFQTLMNYIRYTSKGAITGKNYAVINELLRNTPPDKAAEIVRTVTPILRGRWSATYGGIFKEARSALNIADDSENNIDIDRLGENAVTRMALVTYVYDAKMRQYVRRGE